MNRRTFNQLAALTIADVLFEGLLSGCVSTAAAPAPATYAASKKGQILMALGTPPKSTVLRVFDWDTHHFEDISLPLELVHSITRDKRDPNVAYAFEVFGSGVRVDFSKRSMITVRAGEDDRMFNGHGALSSSGEFIACTELSRTGGSTVALRSTSDFKSVELLPPECWHCHQVISLPNSNLFVTGDMHQPTGGFTFYDSETKKVVDVIKTPHPILHLAPISPTEVIGFSLPQPPTPQKLARAEVGGDAIANLVHVTEDHVLVPGPFYRATVGGKLEVLWDETQKNLFTMILGFAKTSRTHFVSSHRDANAVAIWDDNAITRTISVPKPTSLQISKDGSEFIVIADGKVSLYSMSTYEKIKSFDDWPFAMALSTYS